MGDVRQQDEVRSHRNPPHIAGLDNMPLSRRPTDKGRDHRRAVPQAPGTADLLEVGIKQLLELDRVQPNRRSKQSELVVDRFLHSRRHHELILAGRVLVLPDGRPASLLPVPAVGQLLP